MFWSRPKIIYYICLFHFASGITLTSSCTHRECANNCATKPLWCFIYITVTQVGLCIFTLIIRLNNIIWEKIIGIFFQANWYIANSPQYLVHECHHCWQIYWRTAGEQPLYLSHMPERMIYNVFYKCLMIPGLQELNKWHERFLLYVNIYALQSASCL